MTDDMKRALLGDHEAAKRLTEAGVLLPCAHCGGEAKFKKGFPSRPSFSARNAELGRSHIGNFRWKDGRMWTGPLLRNGTPARRS